MLVTLGERRVDSITPGRRRRACRDAHREGPQARDGAQEPARRRDGSRLRRRHRRQPVSRQDHGAAAARDEDGDRAADRRARRRPFSACFPPATGCRCSCSTRPACGSANSRGCAGATSTSSGAAGASRRPWRRRGTAAGCRCPRSCSRPCSALVAREDRTPERRVFQGFGGDRFRTAITRACTAAGVPAFSPARPPTPPDLAAAPRRRAVGADRRARRPAQPRRHREHVLARPRRRGRARLRANCSPNPRLGCRDELAAGASVARRRRLRSRRCPPMLGRVPRCQRPLG